MKSDIDIESDIEAYLHTFEVIASREAWEKEQWAHILVPFLTGKVQQAYFSLQPPQNDDYDILKGEILARIGLSLVCAVQQFHQWMYDERTPVLAQAAQLTSITHLWLLPGSPTATQVAEKVVIDHLLQALPRNFQRAVSMKNPSSLVELVEAVELAETRLLTMWERERCPCLGV